jgi:hypothetical protein
MKRISYSISALAAVVALATGFAAVPARAAVFDVTVWTAKLASTLADLADMPGTTPTAHFTYTGSLDWSNYAPQNSGVGTGNFVKDFLKIADISGFTSGTHADPVAFGASSLSTNGDLYSSFFLITGSYATASAFTTPLLHDDGVSLYLDGSAVPIFSSPVETAVKLDSVLLPGGAHTYAITYVEGNGSPSVLAFTTAVPEISTWIMMILGFGGVALQMRRRNGAVSLNA